MDDWSTIVMNRSVITLKSGGLGALDEEKIMRLVARIYDTVIDPDHFDLTMSAILDTTQSHFMLLTMTRPGERACIAPRFIGDMSSRMLDGIKDYAAGAAATDPTLAFIAANPTATHFSTPIHVDHDEPVNRQYREWNRHYLGNSHWQARFAVNHGMSLGASLHSRSRDEPHSDEANRAFAFLFGHMVRATRLAARPESLADRSEALVTLNAAGRVIAISPSAQQVVDRGDGVRSHESELLPSDRRLWPRWREAVRATLARHDGEDATMLLPRRTSTRPLAVTMSADIVRPGFGAVASSLLVRIIDPDAAPAVIDPKLLHLWGLTPAEARLAQLLMQNDFALRGAADQLGVSYTTVRTQLASIFAKTDTHGQPELMRLLTRLSG